MKRRDLILGSGATLLTTGFYPSVARATVSGADRKFIFVLGGGAPEHGQQSSSKTKKYQPDPLLGGWVAAVRRSKEMLGDSQLSELDALGFEWVSTRQCGNSEATASSNPH